MWERTASYVTNGNGNLKTYAKSITYNGDTLKTTSTKHTMVYPSNDKGIIYYVTVGKKKL